MEHHMANTIGQIETWIGSPLPPVYRQFLSDHPEDIEGSDLVLLYGLTSFLERNDIHETKHYCPGFVTIGNDGGDMELILSLEDGTFSQVDGGSLDPQHAEHVGDDLLTWIADGCPLPDEEEPLHSAIDRVHVYLEREPASLKTLLLIKQHLGMDTSTAELKALITQTPCSLTEHLSYMQAIHACSAVNEVDPCLGIRTREDETVNLPLTWPG